MNSHFSGRGILRKRAVESKKPHFTLISTLLDQFSSKNYFSKTKNQRWQYFNKIGFGCCFSQKCWNNFRISQEVQHPNPDLTKIERRNVATRQIWSEATDLKWGVRFEAVCTLQWWWHRGSVLAFGVERSGFGSRRRHHSLYLCFVSWTGCLACTNILPSIFFSLKL